MGAVKATFNASIEKSLLIGAYRNAFRRFRDEAQRLTQNANAKDPNTEAALLRLEAAHAAYNESRDELAALLMLPSVRQKFLKIPQSRADVRTIAELFWHLSGKPAGTAEDDWLRAERIVQQADRCVACVS